jgi:membrane-anchored protein YejM (alkaline phosphatase superfamily)
VEGILQDTIVFITSDHGEEFNDNGLNFWGHGSNYTDPQVRVPLLVHWPRIKGGVVGRQTSHLDVVPTIMQSLLRCKTPVQDYSGGQSLFSGTSPGWLLMASYHDYGVRTAGHIIQVHPTGDYDILNERNRPSPDFELDARTSRELIEAMSRFQR